MCMIRIRNIKIRENLKEEEILKKVILKNKIKPEEIEEWHIHKKSIDARKKDDIFFNYAIDIKTRKKKTNLRR